MRRTTFGRSHVHVFVCTNRRPATDPLGPGCGDRGQAVYDAVVQATIREGLTSRVWVTRTFCMGICPKSGATACIGGDVLTEVSPADVAQLVGLAKEALA